MLDAAPGQFGDVNHAVHAADVDECTVGSQRLDNTLVVLVHFDVIPDLLALCCPFFIQDGADGTDHAAACSVHFGDVQANGGAHQLGHGLIAAQAGLRSGDKDTDALDHDDNAALVFFFDNAFQHGLVFPCFFDGLPVLHTVQTLLGQGHNAVLIVDTHDIGFDLIAHMDYIFQLDGRIVRIFFLLDVASVLGTQINLDLSRCDIDNDTDNLVPCI